MAGATAANSAQKRPGCNSRLEKVELFCNALPDGANVLYQIGSTNEYYQKIVNQTVLCPASNRHIQQSPTDARRNGREQEGSDA